MQKKTQSVLRKIKYYDKLADSFYTHDYITNV